MIDCWPLQPHHNPIRASAPELSQDDSTANANKGIGSLFRHDLSYGHKDQLMLTLAGFVYYTT